MNKKEPVITKIEFTKAEQEEIELLNRGELMPRVRTSIDKFGNKHETIYKRQFTFAMARMRLRELYGGGFCTTCEALPIYKVSYDVGDSQQGAKLIQRYCEKCFLIWNDKTRWTKKNKS